MSYAATVFNVMLASPGDVQPERDLAREIILEWNTIHSASRKMILMPTGWETHSYPSTGDRPQGILNKQILQNADLLVAIFWTRIGTHTGEAISGSAEEIQKHLSLGKPAMIYFSQAPVLPDSVDHAQYESLKKFRDEIKEKHLIEFFDARSDFGQKFRRQLPATINSEHIFNEDHIQKTNAQANSSRVIVQEAARKIPQISAEAKILLVEASLDRSGHIFHARYIGGTSIQANQKNLIEDSSPRSVAIWESALDELLRMRLVKALGYKNEMYQVTREGYDVAELIRSQ